VKPTEEQQEKLKVFVIISYFFVGIITGEQRTFISSLLSAKVSSAILIESALTFNWYVVKPTEEQQEKLKVFVKKKLNASTVELELIEKPDLIGGQKYLQQY